MTTASESVGVAPAPPSTTARGLTALIWTIFLGSLGFAGLKAWYGLTVQWDPLVRVDGLAVIMISVVSLIAGIVMSYSLRYMAGNRKMNSFFLKVTGFAVTVMMLVSTNHLLVFACLWTAMGWIMGRLIGHEREWPQARAAGRLSFQYFLASSLYLLVALLVLYVRTGAVTIDEAVSRVGNLEPLAVFVVVAGLVVAAMIQSALFPVQDWIMSSMTAPTPASALMHAGFVNAGGVLLTRFAPVLVEYVTVMLLITFVGAVSALLGKVWKMVQPNVKRQLGCSTVAQMGFMILQCGLGFFSAAITHLILHGFYKGYLFLSSGESVEQQSPGHKPLQPVRFLLELPLALLTGLAGGWLFVVLTGKGTAMDSGVVLVGLVVITVMHATRELIDRTALPMVVRLIVFPLGVLVVTALYAGIFEGFTVLMGDVANVVAPTRLSVVHYVVGGLFLFAYLFEELQIYRKVRWLYVAVLNAGQPHPATVLSSKEEYHD